MTYSDPPAVAAWSHVGSRSGLEAVSFGRRDEGWLAAGSTTAVEGGRAWWVAYEIALDASFVTRRATISSAIGCDPQSSVLLEADGMGRWVVDGRQAPLLDGCLDIDLECSAMTNALPMRRLSLSTGAAAATPAAYVRVQGLAVERLEQHYHRLSDGATGPSFRYEAPALQFSCRIDYDAAGLVVSYPGIAERAI